MAHHSVHRGPCCRADQTPFTVTLGTATLIPVTGCRVPVTHQALGKCSWALCSRTPHETRLCSVHMEKRRLGKRGRPRSGAQLSVVVSHQRDADTRLVGLGGLRSGWTPALCPSRFTVHLLLRGHQWAPALPGPVPTCSTCAPGAPCAFPPCVGGSGDRSLPAPPRRESHCALERRRFCQLHLAPGAERQEVGSRVSLTQCWVDGPPRRHPHPPPVWREKRLALTFLAFVDVLLQNMNSENLNGDPP